MSAAPGAAGRQMVSVVVPVYNEAENIQAFIRGISRALASEAHEILVCYDFDADTTLAAIREMPDCQATVRLVKNDLGRGAAFAIRAGFFAAEGDVVVTTMADLSDPPEAIPLMAAKIRAGASVVSGSRYMRGGSQEGGPLLKRTFSRLAGLSLHWFAGVATHDSTTNFRAYSAEFLRRVEVESRHGFELGLELTVKAHLAGLKVDEVPSSWRDRSAGQSRFRMWKWMPRYLGWYWMAMRPAANRFAALAAAGVFALAMLVPWQPYFIYDSLDASWVMGFNYALEHGMLFGRDVVFTFGPYAFVFGRFYYPPTYALLAWSWAFFTLVFVSALWQVVRARIPNPWAGTLWIAAVTAIVRLTPGLFISDVFFITLAALFLIVYWLGSRARPGATVYLLTAALAWMSLVKFSFALLVAFVIVVVLVEELFRRRMPLRLFAVLAASWLLFWFGAGQGASNIGEFLRNSFVVAAGYSEAMARETLSRARSMRDMAAFILAAALILAAFVAAEWRERRLAGVLRAAGLAGILFLTFKAAFVRHDKHAMIAAFTALSLAIIFLPLLWRLSRRAGRAFLFLALAVALAGVGQGVLFHYKVDVAMDGTAGSVADNVKGISRLWRGTSGLEAEYVSACADVRRQNPLPAIEGPVDIYPYNQGILIAYGFDYAPRPVFQSCTAFRPPLAELNAAYLRSERAPGTILFNIHNIDGRYPTLDDNLSWPELLTRYDVSSKEGRYLLMERAGAPRAFTLVPAGEVQAKFGQWLELPSGAPVVWAKTGVRFAPANRVLNFLWRPIWPILSVRLADGSEKSFRFGASMGRSGFLLSPLVEDADEFALLAAGGAPNALGGRAVRAIKFSVEGGGPGAGVFEPAVAVTLYGLEFPPQRVDIKGLWE